MTTFNIPITSPPLKTLLIERTFRYLEKHFFQRLGYLLIGRSFRQLLVSKLYVIPPFLSQLFATPPVLCIIFKERRWFHFLMHMGDTGSYKFDIVWSERLWTLFQPFY